MRVRCTCGLLCRCHNHCEPSGIGSAGPQSIRVDASPVRPQGFGIISAREVGLRDTERPALTGPTPVHLLTIVNLLPRAPGSLCWGTDHGG